MSTGVRMEISCFLFVCFLSSGSTKSTCFADYECGSYKKCCYTKCVYSGDPCYCSHDYECKTGEQCCDGGCISSLRSCPCSSHGDCITGKLCCNRKCTDDLSSCSCSYDYQCIIGERCCGGECLPYCNTGWSDGAYAGAVVGPIIFLTIIISIVSCYCCACCPYYRYRKPSGTAVETQQPHQELVSTESHMVTKEVQAPQPVNFNQPTLDYNPPPSTYPPPCPAAYPPAQVNVRAAPVPPSKPAKY